MSILQRSLSLLVIVSLLLTGCWDRRELEERSIVAAIAIDADPQGYRISFQVPIPIKIAGSGGGGSEGGQEVVQVFSDTGTTLNEAFSKIRNEINQELFFGYTILLVLGEDVLQTGIGRDLDAFRRNPQIRRRLIPVVVKGKAEKVLRANPKLEQIPAAYIYSLLDNGIRDNRMAEITLGDLFANISDPTRNGVINMIKVKGNSVSWTGLAVLKGDRMIGQLSEQESLALLQLREGKEGKPIEVPCPNGKGSFVFRAKKVKPKIEITDKKGIKIKSVVHIVGDVIESGCINNLGNPSDMVCLSFLVKYLYEHNARNLLNKMQQELKSDIFLYGERIRAYHPRLYRKIDWSKTFPDVKLEVEYQVDIRRYGMESR